MSGAIQTTGCRILYTVGASCVLALAACRPFAQPARVPAQPVAIGTTTQNQAVTQRLNLVAKIPLTAHERASLLRTLAEVLSLYKAHQFDAFKRFVLERKGVPNPAWVGRIRTVPIVRDVDKQPAPARLLASRLPGWPNVSHWDTIHVWWEGRYAGGGVWKSIDPARSFLNVYERDAEPGEDEAHAIAPAAFSNPNNSIMFQVNHFFNPATAKAKYAAVFLVAAPQGKDPVFPRIIWLRWEKSIDNWILDRVAQPYTGARSAHCDLIL